MPINLNRVKELQSGASAKSGGISLSGIEKFKKGKSETDPFGNSDYYRKEALAEKKLAHANNAAAEAKKISSTADSRKLDDRSNKVANIPAYNKSSPFYNTPIIGNILKKGEEKMRETAGKVLTDAELDILSKGLSLKRNSHNMAGGITTYSFEPGQNVPKEVAEKFNDIMQKVEYAQKGMLTKIGDRAARQMVRTAVGDKSAQEYAEATGTANAGKVGNVVGDIAGTVLGYMAPSGSPGTPNIMNASNAFGKQAVRTVGLKIPQLVTKPIVQRVAEGLAEDIPATLYTAFVEKQTPAEAAKTYALQAPFTIGGELGFYGLGKLKNALKKPVSKVAETAAESIPIQKIKVSAAQGKYKVKNVAYDNAVKEYNNAIETIQNYFKTNELRADEVAKIKSELGIDLDDIISRMESAEKNMSLPDADTMKLKRAAGVASDKSYEISKKVSSPQPNAKSQPVIAPAKTGQVNTPAANKVAQNGVQEVTAPKIEIDYSPKTPKQQKYVEQVTAKLPNDADRLTKKIADLEAQKAVEKDKQKLLKIDLQLFAAKQKLKTFADIARGNLPDGEVERGFAKNVRTDKSMPDEIRESFDEKPLGYKQKSNEETLLKAETIMAKGQASAISEYYTMLNGKHYQPETVPLAKLIAKNAQATGDIATARQVLSDAAVKLTEAGQFSQAAKILRESDPQTFIITVQKQLNKLNKEGLKRYKGKWKTLDMTDDEIAKIGKIKVGDNEAFERVMEEIHNRIAKDIPSDAWEKFDSWRRMAMLLNPTTHVRNLLGNVTMGSMQKTSDTIGAALERVFVKQEDRTKSILWRVGEEGKKRLQTVAKAWEANKIQLMKGGRWDLESGVGSLKELNSTKPVFKIKGLETTNKFSKELLNVEDNIFVKAVWENSLGGFMKARGINEVTDEAIEYATKRAYEATFKQANLLSTTISKIKNVPIVGRLAEGAIPFSKTPSNIAMRAFEYSPAGIMKTLYSGISGKGAAQVIEDLSKSLTGTGVAALGFTLAATGWARGKNYVSEKAEALKTKQGEQASSITTPLGSYTLDWMQPTALPFFMGVAMYEELQNPKYDGKLGEAILNSIYKGGDTLFEMSMMQNIKRLFGYGSITQKTAGLALSYVKQAVPSILGKIARSIDPKRRETYDPNPAKEEWNKLLEKMPWLSTTLPEKIDNFGEVMKNSSALEQFLSPGYTKNKDTRPFMGELERLYKIEKNTDIIPAVINGTFTNKGEDIIMAADEYTTFKKRYGETIMNGYTDASGTKHLGLERLIETPVYKNMSDKSKFKRITSLYKKAYDKAKDELLKQRGLK